MIGAAYAVPFFILRDGFPGYLSAMRQGKASGDRKISESLAERSFRGGVSKPAQEVLNAGKKAFGPEQAMAPESVFDTAAVSRLGAQDFMELVFQMNPQRFQVADAHRIQIEGIEIADIDFC